ncbi:MAG: hypothetical protein RLZZ237_1485 [Pseudomonadota bacterium]
MIYNLGVWEEKVFSDDDAFLDDADEAVIEMANINITASILLLKRLVPRLLGEQQAATDLDGLDSRLRHAQRMWSTAQRASAGRQRWPATTEAGRPLDAKSWFALWYT